MKVEIKDGNVFVNGSLAPKITDDKGRDLIRVDGSWKYVSNYIDKPETEKVKKPRKSKKNG